MGSGLFVLGPTLVFIYVAVQLVGLHRTGSLVFVAGEKKSMKEIWNEARGKGCLGMPIHIVNEFSSMRTSGDWEATDDRAEFWLWMLGDFSESGWYYPALQLALARAQALHHHCHHHDSRQLEFMDGLCYSSRRSATPLVLEAF